MQNSKAYDCLIKQMNSSNRYFIISEEQYKWYDTEQGKLDSLYYEFAKMNNQSEYFYFSNWEKENNDEQNDLMWKYTYKDMLVGKNRDDIHKKIGKPNEVFDDGRIEKYQISSSIVIQVVYKENLSVEIK